MTQHSCYVAQARLNSGFSCLRLPRSESIGKPIMVSVCTLFSHFPPNKTSREHSGDQGWSNARKTQSKTGFPCSLGKKPSLCLPRQSDKDYYSGVRGLER